jgi:hypothetical protein
VQRTFTVASELFARQLRYRDKPQGNKKCSPLLRILALAASGHHATIAIRGCG